MKKVILIGAGAHAAELHYHIEYWNENNRDRPVTIAGLLSDSRKEYDHYQFKEPWLGPFDSHEIVQDAEYLPAFASADYRKGIIESFMKRGAAFTRFIHPTALIAPSAQLGEGVVISHNVSVGPMAKVGNFNLLNSRCTIGHDTVTGDYNVVSPQVVLAGHTHMGDENMVGTNACTIPHISIGNRNTIAAGMTVYKDVEDDETVMFRHRERLVVQHD